MSDPFLIPITLAISATSLVLIAGLAGLARPILSRSVPDPSGYAWPKVSRSNQLMRARVLFQAVAVVLILAGAAYKKSHRPDAKLEAQSTRFAVAAVQAPTKGPVQ